MAVMIPFIAHGTYFGRVKKGSYERQGTYGMGWLDAYLFSERDFSSGRILLSHETRR